MDFEKMDLKWQNMMAGIEAQVPFIRHSPSAIYQQVRQRLSLKEIPSRVYLVGCGDSWYCGIATRLAFEAWAGVPTEAMQALEFSRYYFRHAPPDSLLVAISNSGRVSRTIEAILRAKDRGIKTVAGTGNPGSRIAREADVVIDLGYAERRFAPGTSSYMASMIVEYCIALRLAEFGGAMSAPQVEVRLAEISDLANGMQKTIEVNKSTLEQLGKQAELNSKLIFIGGGPNYGTAFFSMAKLIESARVNAAGQELEEWAHEQYFVTGPDTYTFVIAPPGASLDRAREQLWAANQMGSTTVALCDAEDTETAAIAKVTLPVYGGADEILSPIPYCIPGQLFAYYYATWKKLTMLGFGDEQVKEVNFQQIFNSRIVA